jgi:hypothetical protein
VADRGTQRLGGALLAVTLVVGLAACSDSEGDYCEAFLDSRQELSDLTAQQAEAGKSGQGVDVLTPTLQSFEELRELSPDELRDEWDTLVFAYRDLADAVERTGTDPADFQVGESPEGVSPEARQELARVAGKLDAPRVVEAASGVEVHAAQVCEEPAPEESP